MEHLEHQNIGNTRVIIADCSTDNTRKVINDTKGDLNVEIIDGGPVSIAKNNGAKLVETPYILFIDSDVRFFSDTVIDDCVNIMELYDYDHISLFFEPSDTLIELSLDSPSSASDIDILSGSDIWSCSESDKTIIFGPLLIADSVEFSDFSSSSESFTWFFNLSSFSFSNCSNSLIFSRKVLTFVCKISSFTNSLKIG